MGFVFPLAVGLWAVSWAMEDAGLMHYAFKSEDNYEIEPIHIRYTSYLKGYAGISALMFVIQFTMYQANQNSLEDGLLILAVVLLAIVCFFPAYFLFTFYAISRLDCSYCSRRQLENIFCPLIYLFWADEIVWQPRTFD